MINSLARLFKNTLRPRTAGHRLARPQDLQTIRVALMQCIHDVESLPASRLRRQITKALTVQELWLLRNDAYQLVSQRHSQTIAADRINGMLKCFKCCMDARQLVRIQ